MVGHSRPRDQYSEAFEALRYEHAQAPWYVFPADTWLSRPVVSSDPDETMQGMKLRNTQTDYDPGIYS